MPVYVVVDAASGKRLRQSDVAQKDVEPIDPKTEALRVIHARQKAPDESLHVWDADAQDFADVPVIAAPAAPAFSREDLTALQSQLTTALDTITQTLAALDTRGTVRGG